MPYDNDDFRALMKEQLELDELQETEETCPECGNNPSLVPHVCPFKKKVYEQRETCTCCLSCSYICYLDT